ncbi:hypothetical protein C5B42_04230 [Candidatus Cerribacteria bacterium 'Amazon FNV 2010 28 9']|uniref:Transcriptional regulator n=1 Tax=Candidatus Cerribacteria bacterium 'Amazon FNV 2010 28 9' TaxID=2081795 RepID=A0A317JP91_9BACT|nr:MAG: hypothetical protein C5B42_04230 [Candidatus Cerribacteria bacterium 'Amazon FNV 2010 28 9']
MKSDDVAKKLRRLQGQIAGIIKMYDEDRSCLEIIQQVAAARSALSSVGRDILTGEACKCASVKPGEDFDKILKSLLELT